LKIKIEEALQSGDMSVNASGTPVQIRRFLQRLNKKYCKYERIVLERNRPLVIGCHLEFGSTVDSDDVLPHLESAGGFFEEATALSGVLLYSDENGSHHFDFVQNSRAQHPTSLTDLQVPHTGACASLRDDDVNDS